MENKKEPQTVKNLKAAHYNSRKASKDQLDRLKKAIYALGDLSGIVFNRQTGNIVCGHQRCRVIPKDAPIEILKRYDIPTRTGTTAEGFIIVDAERYAYREVDWDIIREKTANIAANHQGGEDDLEKLNEILKELMAAPNVDIALTGFNIADLYRTFGGNPLEIDTQKLMDLSEELEKSRAALNEAKKKVTNSSSSIDSYLVVVFRDYEARKEFTDALGLQNNRYVDGRALQGRLEKT